MASTSRRAGEARAQRAQRARRELSELSAGGARGRRRAGEGRTRAAHQVARIVRLEEVEGLACPRRRRPVALAEVFGALQQPVHLLDELPVLFLHSLHRVHRLPARARPIRRIGDRAAPTRLGRPAGAEREVGLEERHRVLHLQLRRNVRLGHVVGERALVEGHQRGGLVQPSDQPAKRRRVQLGKLPWWGGGRQTAGGGTGVQLGGLPRRWRTRLAGNKRAGAELGGGGAGRDGRTHLRLSRLGRVGRHRGHEILKHSKALARERAGLRSEGRQAASRRATSAGGNRRRQAPTGVGRTSGLLAGSSSAGSSVAG